MSISSDRIPRWIRTQYPAIVNGTAHPLTVLIIRNWLKHRPDELRELQELESLSKEIQKQPELSPSPLVYRQIQKQLGNVTTQTVPVTVQWQLWLVPLLFLLLAGFLLKQALPPVIPVNWSVEGQDIELFRVYRVSGDTADDSNSNNGQLIYEISVDTAEDNYGFADTILFPSTEVVYRIDGLGQDDLLAATVTFVGDGLTALLGQLFLIIIGIFIAYVLWFIGHQAVPKNKERGFDFV